MLSGVAPSDYHESITNALTLSATVSLIDRRTFSGEWPNAEISSRGLFAGWESYWVGDTVVLFPEKPQAVAEVMVITDIVTSFHALQPEANGRDVTGSRCKTISIELRGNVYTTEPARSLSRLRVPVEEHKAPMQGYGEWYYLDQPNDVWATPFTRVLSRLYEKEAVEAWIPSLRQTTSTELLDCGREGTVHDRNYAASTDERIIDTDTGQKRWFWDDCRAEALDIANLAGLDVGAYDQERKPAIWREVLRVLDGVADKVSAPAFAFTKASTVSRSEGSSLVGEKRRHSEVGAREGDSSVDEVVDGLIRGEGINVDEDEEARRKKARVEVKVPAYS
ncbi:MAG: hypothetical protein LQ338_007521 [Usnochroma carphineum]|nr:MAG: hypothetical protein LQ338_007521 [Usnochroma carphineum]